MSLRRLELSVTNKRHGNGGIADSLLEYACDYAKENGFDYIEGYPSDGVFDARNCGGTDSMYIKRGFQIGHAGSRIIARKKLGN